MPPNKHKIPPAEENPKLQERFPKGLDFTPCTASPISIQTAAKGFHTNVKDARENISYTLIMARLGDKTEQDLVTNIEKISKPLYSKNHIFEFNLF